MRTFASASFLGRSLSLSAQPQPAADYTLRIAPIRLEIAPGKFVHTTAFNGRVPGNLIRLREGQQVTIDVINETDANDIVHWHGLHIPSVQDGATEEGSPESAAHGGVQRYTWVAQPAGFRWYHSHAFAGHNLNRATYTGEFGFLIVDPASSPGRYDQEMFLALHDWDGHAQGGAEDYQEVVYSHATINDRMLGFGEPIRVSEGQRVLFHVLNASATLMHDLALPGHRFLVTALDGNPVPNPSLVETIRLGPAERVDAIVEMNQPGIWILGETDAAIRKSGMGIVVEYAGRSGSLVWRDPSRFDFQYENFGAPSAAAEPDPDEDVVLLAANAKTEVAFTANNPGKTLFHCHQQDHMDSGFMMLFDYA